MTTQKLKVAERIHIAICAVLLGVPLILWVWLRISYAFVIAGILLTNLFTLLFVIFLHIKYRRQQEDFLKKAFSYWRSILISEIVYLMVWLILF